MYRRRKGRGYRESGGNFSLLFRSAPPVLSLSKVRKAGEETEPKKKKRVVEGGGSRSFFFIKRARQKKRNAKQSFIFGGG